MYPKGPHREDEGLCLCGGQALTAAAIQAPAGIDTLVTASEAAQLCGVTVAAISNWASRGYTKRDGTKTTLAATDTDRHGRKLYRILDVAKAERATRDRARR